ATADLSPLSLHDALPISQSRKRLITPTADNFGFARWAFERAEILAPSLGEGLHYGEWWGKGIQRGYGMDTRVFSLFDTSRWSGEDRKSTRLNSSHVKISY